MKFNIECVRDVLLEIESLDFNHSLPFKELAQKLDSYSSDELSYTCLKLYEAGFLKIVIKNTGTSVHVVRIIDITYEGHQFLENIRNQSMWDKIKEKAHSIGSISIPVIQQIAGTVLTDSIQSLQ